MTDTKSETVIVYLKSSFARYGIPKVLFSNNSPQYCAHELKIFTDKWEIKHVTSSINYRQSNGIAECAVQSINKLLKTCDHNQEDPYLALLN